MQKPELNFTVHTYRDPQHNEFTQVTADCACGRGGWVRLAKHPEPLDSIADELVEKRYNLRITHNHGDMKWYAYYAGKDQRGLFDDDIDWQTASDTPTEALDKLRQLLEGGKL